MMRLVINTALPALALLALLTGHGVSAASVSTSLGQVSARPLRPRDCAPDDFICLAGEAVGAIAETERSTRDDATPPPFPGLPEQPPVTCSGSTCTCGSGGYDYTITGYNQGSTDAKVHGCGGKVKFDGSLSIGVEAGSPSGEIGVTATSTESEEEWEGCCARCGLNLEGAGFLQKGNWYCEKDLFNTGIWLKEGSNDFPWRPFA